MARPGAARQIPGVPDAPDRLDAVNAFVEVQRNAAALKAASRTPGPHPAAEAICFATHPAEGDDLDDHVCYRDAGHAFGSHLCVCGLTWSD
jgi:hypothetical protein